MNGEERNFCRLNRLNGLKCAVSSGRDSATGQYGLGADPVGQNGAGRPGGVENVGNPGVDYRNARLLSGETGGRRGALAPRRRGS